MRATERVAGLIEYYGRSFKFIGHRRVLCLHEELHPKNKLVWELVVTDGKFENITVIAETIEEAKNKLLLRFKLQENRKI